jgi:alpha-glucosidase
MSDNLLWWQKGIIYQIYPRSFKDSNGDGIGDLPGITGKLDYVQSIGVDAIWLSPIYPSPMADFGYDISDYENINPLFGTLEDFDRLVQETHARGLKLVLDLVPNHTSDRHAWFLESRASRDNPKRDWYIWRDPAPGGGPPNNWLSAFGGSAWEYDAQTGQYYLHTFLKQQPDLNWRNPQVREAMLNMMRFWLDRGVDGFRVDVMWYMVKDALFRDEPRRGDLVDYERQYDAFDHIYSMDQPEVHEVVREMRKVLDSYPERMMVGEIDLPVHRLVTYYGEHNDEAHLPFNFALIQMPYDAKGIREFAEEYERAIPPGGWPNWVLGNHDKHRIGSRVGTEQARVAQMMLLTFRGTPTCYYGDEIGMVDVDIPPEVVQDPWELQEPGLGLGRDPERTPMQWDTSRHAGFTTGDPWLPLPENYPAVNVEVESRDPRSMLSLYKALTSLRRSTPALAVGSIKFYDPGCDDVLLYVREHDGARIVVALNLGEQAREVQTGEVGQPAELLLSTHLDRGGAIEQGAGLSLRPNEGLVIRLA